MATSLNIGCKFDSKNKVVSELNSLISQVQGSANSIKLNFDMGDMTNLFNEIKKQSNSLAESLSKINNIGMTEANKSIQQFNDNLSKTEKNSKKLAEVISVTNKYKDGENIANITKYSSALGEVTTEIDKINSKGEITQLETVSQNFDAITQKVEKYKQVLTNLDSNGIVGKNSINEYLNQLSDTSNMTGASFNKLGEKISQLQKNESAIVSLDKKLKKFTSDLNSIKTNRGTIDGLGGNVEQITQLENKINELSNMRNKLFDGDFVGANKIKQQVEEVKSSLDSLKGAFNTPKDVLGEYRNKLNSLSSGGIVNTGAINKYFNELKNGAKLSSTELDKLKKNIDNLVSNESKIVNLQRDINNINSDISKIESLSKSSKSPISGSDITDLKNKVKELEQVKERLSNGEFINSNKLKNDVNSVKSSLRDLKSQLDNTSKGFTGFKNVLGGLGVATTGYMAISQLFSELKNGVNTVIEIESSMVSLQRVFTMNDEQAKEFISTMGDMATALASSTKDMIDTTTTFKKLGYTINESKELAEQVTKFNLAGDIDNIGQATLDVVSILKGYNLEANDVVEVTDEMNAVANNFALTAQDIADIMQRSSSAMAVAGNSVKESIALGTVAQEVKLYCLLCIEIYIVKSKKKTGKLSISIRYIC